jgi:hypothetical protein
MEHDRAWDDWSDVLDSLDPETDADLYEVAIDREMTLEIGLVARCHVRLDQALHATVGRLTGQIPNPKASTTSLIDRIEKNIPKVSLPDSTLALIMTALSDARDANERRNRVMHDQWMAVFDDEGPRLHRIQRESLTGIDASTETRNALSSTSDDLMSAYYRVLGILILLGLSKGASDVESDTDCQKAVALIAGTPLPRGDAEETLDF